MKIAFVYPEVYDVARFGKKRKEFPPFSVLYLATIVNAQNDMTVKVFSVERECFALGVAVHVYHALEVHQTDIIRLLTVCDKSVMVACGDVAQLGEQPPGNSSSAERGENCEVAESHKVGVAVVLHPARKHSIDLADEQTLVCCHQQASVQNGLPVDTEDLLEMLTLEQPHLDRHIFCRVDFPHSHLVSLQNMEHKNLARFSI